MTLNKTQFKLLDYMYNHNEYHQTLTNFTVINQAIDLSERRPDLFCCKRYEHRRYVFSISTFADVLPLLKYNSKYEELSS